MFGFINRVDKVIWLYRKEIRRRLPYKLLYCISSNTIGKLNNKIYSLENLQKLQNCTYPGGGACSLLRAKGFTIENSPSQANFILVPRFDREFVMTLQRHGFSAAKMARDLNWTFIFNEDLCLKKWSKFSDSESLRKNRTSSLL